MPDREYEIAFPRCGSVVGADELAMVAELLRSGDPLSQGGWRDEFERRFADHIGSKHALSVTSGTVALELAIGLLDLRAGDEVVVTPQTFQATVQPLLDRDVTVRFCDVDPDTLNLDPAAVESLVNDRTAAVILVHYGGAPAEMERIVTAAHRHGAVVIEDCAHSLGASYRGRHPGSLADIGCFSFHNSKNITTLGEGGMITVDRDDWAERIDRLRSNQVDGDFVPASAGGPPATPLLPWMKYAEEVYGLECVQLRRSGTNATLSEAAAAVGLVQLERMATLTARRQEIAARLDQVLAAYPQVRPQRAAPGDTHAYHLYTCFVDAGPDAREQLVRELDRRGVEVQLRYFPLHLVPEWRARGHRLGECPVAEQSWFNHHINLPCHPSLTTPQLDRLTEALSEALTTALTPIRADHELKFMIGAPGGS